MAAVTPADVRIEAHQSAITLSVADIARELSQLLTRDLTAYIVKVGDPGTISRWTGSKVGNIRPVYEQKLRLAYEIVQLFRACGESDQTIRGWFIGLNPHLDDDPPAEAIREGNLKETLAAARAFIAGSY